MNFVHSSYSLLRMSFFHLAPSVLNPKSQHLGTTEVHKSS